MSTPSTATPLPEFNYDVAFFLLTARTNLQPGVGGENYWVIDNLVQRDTCTNLPCIYGSSMKGGIREFMKHQLKQSKSNWLETLYLMLGNDKSDAEEEEYKKTVNGIAKEQGVEEKDVKKINIPSAYRILQADLLSIPVRSDARFYYNVSSPWLIGNFVEKLVLFNRKLNGLNDYFVKLTDFKDFSGNSAAHHAFEGEMGVLEEDGFSATYNGAVRYDNATGEPAEKHPKDLLSTLLGDSFALAKDQVLAELTDDYHLPVLARNALEDGISKNLWYEQVLPPQTRLVFPVLYPKGDPNFDTFRSSLTCGHPIQIGSNATVGYGFCTITEIPTTPVVTS